MDLEAKAQAALDAKEAEDTKVEDPGQDDAQDQTKDAQDTQGDAETKDAKKDGADAGKEDDADNESNDEEPVDESNFDVDALPDRSRYIYDNLPILSARGHGKDGKDRIFQVRTAQELPDDFEFTSKRDELLFVQEIADQAQRANILDTRWQQKEQQTKFQEWQNQQALDVASDLKDLQKEGLIPKFTDKQANDEPTNPGVKLANEVYDYMQKVNTARANAGKPYFLSYRDAAELVLAKKGVEAKPTKQADEARRQTATKIGAGAGTSREMKRPQKFNSVWDIVDLHESELD